jgi:superfamily II RNA helicase
MSDDMPEQPKTLQLPTVPDWAIELTRSVKAGFIAAEERFDKQDAALLSQGAKLDKVVTEGIETNVRMTRFEVRLEDLEGRAGKTSLAVRGASMVDMEQAAQLVQERAAREALAKEVDDLKKSQATQLAILERLDKLAEKPAVKVILFALGTIATGYLASKGLTK